jgi:hypothetical protein
VSQGIRLGAVTIGLAALTETGSQETGMQVIDLGQTAGNRSTFIAECF